MAIFGLATQKEVAQTIREALAAKKDKGIVSELEYFMLDRTKSDIAKWRLAIEEWEDEYYPDRYEMMQIYQEIEMDDSVATHLNSIKMAIAGTEYEIGSTKGEEFEPDLEKTNLINKGFLQELISHIIDSEMQGFTLLEITPSDQLTDDNIKLIPRHLVIPEKGLVRKRPQVENDGIDYTHPRFKSTLLQIGHKTGKGLFNKLAVLYIYKKNALSLWANYQAKFGIPPVIVKTDLTNKTKVDSLSNFLGEMRSNSFALVGFDDEVSVLQGVNTDAFNTFLNLITHSDQQIAKVLEGQTMTSNDGSSRSQAEVHERVAEEYHLARLRRAEQIINEKVIPLLIEYGYKLEGQTFKFKETKDVDLIIDRIVKLKQAGYAIAPDYASQITGMPVEDIPKTEQTPPGNQKPDPAEVKKAKAMLEEIDALYKSATK